MKTYIASLNILSETELDKIDDYLESRTVQKGEVLLEENKVCNELYFIKSGVIRSYYIDFDGTEVTSCIAFDNKLVCALSSFISQKPSLETIHVLLDCEIQVIKYNDLEKLYDSSIPWQKVGRKIIEEQYLLTIQSVVTFRQNNGTELYEYIQKNYAQLMNRIPQHYIASYLGISTRHLTRIRKSVL